MKLLFLRGQVPKDRDPKQIMFDNISDCDDYWTQLAYNLNEEYGEILYWGGNRKVKYSDNFIERWVPDFNSHKIKYEPDVIFARGGFKEYNTVLQRFPKAKKIYYGAGKRFKPQDNIIKYNLILNDSEKQLKETQKEFKDTKVSLWIKSAAENIFYPKDKEKKYDIIMVANEHPKGIKGHDFLLPILNKYKSIQIGISSSKNKLKYKNIEFTDWIPRKEVSNYYAMAKVAVIAVDTIDSCPRVIPEALACNCPILALDSINFWADKYISKDTGIISIKEKFEQNLNNMISNYKNFSVIDYYNKNLSMKNSVDHLKSLI
jgi:hypothetical protein